MGEAFGLHRTVARAHLEKLTELGLVESGKRHRAGGGRPAKTYAYTGERLEVMLPRAALRAARAFPAGRHRREHVHRRRVRPPRFALGRMYGEDVSQQLNGADAAAAAAAGGGGGLAGRWPATTSLWTTATRRSSPSTCTTACTASWPCEYPHIVCYFDRGLLCGMLGADQSQHHQAMAIALGDEHCRHEFRL